MLKKLRERLTALEADVKAILNRAERVIGVET